MRDRQRLRPAVAVEGASADSRPGRGTLSERGDAMPVRQAALLARNTLDAAVARLVAAIEARDHGAAVQEASVVKTACAALGAEAEVAGVLAKAPQPSAHAMDGARTGDWKQWDAEATAWRESLTADDAALARVDTLLGGEELTYRLSSGTRKQLWADWSSVRLAAAQMLAVTHDDAAVRRTFLPARAKLQDELRGLDLARIDTKSLPTSLDGPRFVSGALTGLMTGATAGVKDEKLRARVMKMVVDGQSILLTAAISIGLTLQKLSELDSVATLRRQRDDDGELAGEIAGYLAAKLLLGDDAGGFEHEILAEQVVHVADPMPLIRAAVQPEG